MRHVTIIKPLLIFHSIKSERNKLGEYESNAEDYTFVTYKTVKNLLVFWLLFVHLKIYLLINDILIMGNNN